MLVGVLLGIRVCDGCDLDFERGWVGRMLELCWSFGVFV